MGRYGPWSRRTVPGLYPEAAWSGSAAGSGQVLIRLQYAQKGVEAGGEALVAVAVPGVDPVSGQGGEAGGGQGAEERVQLLSGRAVAKSLFGRRCGIGEGEAEGVVIDEAEGQGGFAAG